jgi:hypothetical protein
MEIQDLQEQGRVPVTVFKLKGTFTSEVELQEKAEVAHKNGAHYMLLDLSEVTYLSSAGLRALHSIFSLLRTHGENDEATKKGIVSGTYLAPNLKLYNPNKNVLQVLKTSGYDMFLEIHSDYQKALASF